MIENDDRILDSLTRIAQTRGLTLSGLAAAAGLNKDTLTRSRGRGGTPSMATLRKLAAYLGMPVEDLVKAPGMPPELARTWRHRTDSLRERENGPFRVTLRKDLPVRGTAAGSAMNGFQISGDVIEYVLRPPTLDSVPDAYAIQVVSESMSPLHRPGDLCFVHPHRFCRRGDSVIIQIRAPESTSVEAYIKIFVRETPEEFVVEQLNPNGEIRYSKSRVVSVHKVLTMNELFGV